MNNKRKSYIINNDEVVVEAENALYSGVSGTDNVAGALDSINDELGSIDARVDALENSGSSDALSVYTYTEDDCTVENTAVAFNGNVGTYNNFNCSDYIPIPEDKKLKMYVKFNYNNDTYGIYCLNFYTKKTGEYAFLSTIGAVGPYADWTEVALPELADAIRLNAKKGYQISVKFVEQPVADTPAVKLKVAAWNIGGLGNGSADTTITAETADAKRSAYRKVFDKVNADIFCISEYFPYFIYTSQNPSTGQKTFDLNTREEILSNYPFYKLGQLYTLNCNCVFSKFPIVSTKQVHYSNNTAYTMTRYLKEVTLKINGKIVKVVTTHLAEENDAHTTNMGLAQIEQLIERYADCPYVIIGADFNIHITDRLGDYVDGSGTDGYLNYKYFTDAGYTLLRFDYLDHSMLVNPLSASTADNIVVKGFAMGQREFIYEQGVSENLSDHCMIACELVML